MTTLSSKKLAFFVPSMRGGGAERVTLNLVKNLAQQGYQLDVLLAQKEGPYLQEIPSTVRVIDLAASGVLASLPKLIKYLKTERPMSLLSVMNHTNIIALWAKRLARVPTRLIVSEHNTLSSTAQAPSKWRGQFLPFLMRHFYPWADGIVAVSGGVADDLAQSIGLARDRIQVIYNPVITPTLRHKASQPLSAPLAQQIFGPNQPPVIMAVGRMSPQKDFTTLIQAFAQVTVPAHLLILGEGPDRPELEALVKSLQLESKVSLPGFVDNPYAYMRKASLFVLSSRWEGLPTVLIEALYCGTPLVSTDCPSGPKEIMQDGKYGHLVPVGDVAALANAITKSLSTTTPQPRSPSSSSEPPSPSSEPLPSWFPFDLNTVTDQYLTLFLET